MHYILIKRLEKEYNRKQRETSATTFIIADMIVLSKYLKN